MVFSTQINFSMNRQQLRTNIEATTFDICIIGGGITGAGIFKLATEKGWKVLLLDKNDFGSGTSSRSSKILHGGIRYLKNLEIAMVRDSLQSRREIMAQYPHLVIPFSVILPLLKSQIDGWIKHFFVALYHWLAGKNELKGFKKHNREDIQNYLVGFDKTNLRGGLLYWEAWLNDARLTNEVIAEAVLQGGIALNHCKVVAFSFDEENRKRAVCEDQMEQVSICIKAHTYINAAGPWVDEVHAQQTKKESHCLTPSKGVHVVIPTERLGLSSQVLIESVHQDKRYLYNLPWENDLTILGSTDTDYEGNKEEVVTTEAEIHYILDAFNWYFPEACLSIEDVVAVYAGLRPTLNSTSVNSYNRSREYKIWWSADDILNIAGGKLSSFLAMAQKCIEQLEDKLPPKIAPKVFEKQKYDGIWQKKYGKMGVYIEQILCENPDSNVPFCEDFDYTKAEIIYFVRFQHVVLLNDLLTYRTSITLAMKSFKREVVYGAALVIAQELKKNDQWIVHQMNDYYTAWREFHPIYLNQHGLQENSFYPERN